MSTTLHPNTSAASLNVISDTITPLLSNPQFEMFIVEGHEGSGPPPHRHEWAEGYLVLDGEVLLGQDDTECVAKPGDLGVSPGGSLHWYRVLSPTARFLLVTGGDRAGAFFSDMNATVPTSDYSPEVMELIFTVAKRNGLTSPLFD